MQKIEAIKLMKRPNALPPDRLSRAERRTEICRLFAAGLVRLHMREAAQRAVETGDFPLHNPPNQSGTAEPTHRRTA